MNDILVITDGPAGAATRAAAATIGRVLRCEVRDLELRRRPGEASHAAAVVDALRESSARLSVVPVESREDCLGWQVAQLCEKPIVLVPEGAREMRSVRRILLPLDGHHDSHEAISAPLLDFVDAGVEVAVLHVFTPENTPRFWDQHAHARVAWEDDFLGSHPLPDVDHVLLRHAARAGEQVAEVAKSENADLIVLGWSRRLVPGHALTVRAALRANLPVMLAPIVPTGTAGATGATRATGATGAPAVSAPVATRRG